MSASRGWLGSWVVVLAWASATSAGIEDELAACLRQSSRTDFSVRVVEAETGRVVFDHQGERALVPASNMKLLTTAAALCELGPDYAHETRLVLGSRPVEGVVRGSLVVVGGGDPTISRRFDPEPLLSDWAQALWDVGVRRIEGDVVADDRAFDREWAHSSWEQGDLERWYGAEVAGLSLNDNCIDVDVAGGERAPTVTLRPSTRYVALDVQAGLTGQRDAHQFGIQRLGPDRRTVRVTGRVWSRSSGYETSVPVHDPAMFFACVLRERLAERGIEVTGGVRRVGAQEEVRGLNVFRRRAPLLRTLGVTNQNSQNFYAESLLKTLGRERGAAGSWVEGAAVVERFAEECGAPAAQVVVADGSGLSRDNRLSARALVEVLRAVDQGPHGDAFRASLAAPGENGTLRRRLRDLPEGVEVRAKTGTLTGVASLSGYVDVGSRRYVFSVLGNGGSVGGIRQAADGIVRRLAALAE